MATQGTFVAQARALVEALGGLEITDSWNEFGEFMIDTVHGRLHVHLSDDPAIRTQFDRKPEKALDGPALNPISFKWNFEFPLKPVPADIASGLAGFEGAVRKIMVGVPPHVDPGAEALARAFCEELRWRLTNDQMDEVIARNRLDASDPICHSHDFCDAKMAMYWAARNIDCRLIYLVPETEPEERTDARCELWSKAWDLAKKAEFVAERIPLPA